MIAVAVQVWARAIFELNIVSIEIATHGIKWRPKMETFIDLPIDVSKSLNGKLIRPQQQRRLVIDYCA